MFGIKTRDSHIVTINISDISTEEITLLYSLGFSYNPNHFMYNCSAELISLLRANKRLLPNVNFEPIRPAQKFNVGIAALITAKSRIRLVKAIESIGIENIAYFDTDCLIFTDLDINETKLEIGVGLGE
ncbi:MAG: hypothetical protein GY738_30795 [Pseudoalteromonas sp.]|nr:hypothetical protein [Pseudoalteromonas sp.]